MRNLKAGLVIVTLLAVTDTAHSFEINAEDMATAAGNYAKYCALCHGPEREGHANDHAPSLRSESLMKTGFPHNIYLTVSYGRLGTPMAGFIDEVGGPMSKDEIVQLLYWIRQISGVTEQVDLDPEPVMGNVALGAKLYAQVCAQCHGEEGEGVTGTALGNPAMLSLTEDKFLRYAIENGRDETEMKAYGEKLSAKEIDALTAFLRSRATGWAVKKPVYRAPPEVGEYIINPDSDAPQFELKDDLYVMSADLHQALQEKHRMVILDTRIMSYWQMVNIEGSVPVPYYFENFEQVAANLPTDGTWIITYCECPRAAAELVNRRLKSRGFENTAVLWEGIQGWVGLGYPVFRGETTTVEVQALP
ncbi:MAG: c-type cytochrome [Gammaproteobacteria bacterium]|nr:c-type cytochrome [Gammaproteobacteria bacterium]